MKANWNGRHLAPFQTFPEVSRFSKYELIDKFIARNASNAAASVLNNAIPFRIRAQASRCFSTKSSATSRRDGNVIVEAVLA